MWLTTYLIIYLIIESLQLSQKATLVGTLIYSNYLLIADNLYGLIRHISYITS